MNKDAYYEWIDENDTYPKHSHKWIVGLYNKYESVEALHRYFGPFETVILIDEGDFKDA
jgi:hypothetical protein